MPAGAISHWGEVDDHGDVPVAATGVPPHVLIDPDDLHPLEAVLLVDQHPLALGQNGVVGGVPGHREPLGDPSHGQGLDHDPFQRPPQSAPRQLGPGLGRGGGVLAPHIPAAAAAVTAHDDLQCRGPPAQWFVGKPSDHGVTWSPFAAAAPAPLVGLDHLAGQYGTIRLESLPGDDEAEFVEAAEGSQVGAGERISAPVDGSVVHVEVFRAECVGALILGRPRPLSGHRRAGPPRDVRYTLIWEEPDYKDAPERIKKIHEEGKNAPRKIIKDWAPRTIRLGQSNPEEKSSLNDDAQ